MEGNEVRGMKRRNNVIIFNGSGWDMVYVCRGVRRYLENEEKNVHDQDEYDHMLKLMELMDEMHDEYADTVRMSKGSADTLRWHMSDVITPGENVFQWADGTVHEFEPKEMEMLKTAIKNLCRRDEGEEEETEELTMLKRLFLE